MFTQIQVGQIAQEGGLGYWLKRAESAAFRKGIGTKNPVEPGIWSDNWQQKLLG